MSAKIEAALNAVKPGSTCCACVVASGSDYDSIRSILGDVWDSSFGSPKGTLFATINSELYKVALEETYSEKVC